MCCYSINSINKYEHKYALRAVLHCQVSFLVCILRVKK